MPLASLRKRSVLPGEKHTTARHVSFTGPRQMPHMKLAHPSAHHNTAGLDTITHLACRLLQYNQRQRLGFGRLQAKLIQQVGALVSVTQIHFLRINTARTNRTQSRAWLARSELHRGATVYIPLAVTESPKPNKMVMERTMCWRTIPPAHNAD